jgi:hypothetical protein
MKRIIGRLVLFILIIITFVCSLSFLRKSDIHNQELLAYIDKVKETTSETTSSSETTTTSEVITTTTTITTINKVSGIGEIKGNVDIYYLNLMNNELKKLPSNAIRRFVNSGWHIYVTNENIANTIFNGKYKSVQGVTIYSERTILIEARETAIKESTLHEFGHFIDYITGFESDEKEFKGIYDEEVDTFKSRIINSSCVRDEQEFFAETFYYYFINPSKCTPKAYDFINKKLINI